MTIIEEALEELKQQISLGCTCQECCEVRNALVENPGLFEEFDLNYNLGNLLKYILRCAKKDDRELDFGRGFVVKV